MIQPIGILAPEVQKVVQYAYANGGFTTRSDFAREHMEPIAAAACQLFLTTEVPGEGFGNVWRATALGVDALFIAVGYESNLYAHGTLPEAMRCEPAVLN